MARILNYFFAWRREMPCPFSMAGEKNSRKSKSVVSARLLLNRDCASAIKKVFASWDCMATHISQSPEQTEQLREQLGRTLRKGSVVGLIGDLGAGKTQLVKGIARGLGIKSRVHSPTFTLVNEYASGDTRCYHID